MAGTVNWQVTAATIFCDAVDDEVTILVYKDWSAKCTGYDKYTKSREYLRELAKKSRLLGWALNCEGTECSRVAEYKGKLMAEENEEGLSEPTGKA